MKYAPGSTLQIALFKIKIRLLESDQKWLRHGSSTKPLLSRCFFETLSHLNVITFRKNLFFEKINLLCNSVHLDRQNDVKFNMFRCLIPLI